MAEPKARLDGPEAHARIDRLNTWVATLHRRVEALEARLGIAGLDNPPELVNEPKEDA